MPTLMRFAGLALSLCFIARATALASNSASVRDLSRTTLRPCPAPQMLKEHYTVFSAPRGESVQIACLRSPMDADWIFSAESGCNDDNSECDPGLAHPPEGTDRTGNLASVITYTAAKYEIDEDCARETYMESDGEQASEADPFWSCKLYTMWKKPVRITTTGATTATPDYNDPALEYDAYVHAGRESSPGFVRDLSSTTIRACPTGRTLAEHHARNAGALPSETLEIACLRTPTVADWIFLSGSRCLDKRCVPKPLAVPVDQKAPGASTSASVRTYDVANYAIGEDCTLRSFRRLDDGHPSGPFFYWACTRYERPARSASPRRVETTGPSSDKADASEEAPNLPLAATLAPDFYTSEGPAKER